MLLEKDNRCYYHPQMALGSRVKIRREQLEMTQMTLAKMVGVSQESIALLEKRDSKSSRNTAKLAAALQTTAEWLEHGDQSKGPPINNVEPASLSPDVVPIISWVQAGDWQEAMDLQHPNDTEYETVHKIAGGRQVFGLRVRGDSMTAPPGVHPSFPEGYIIQVDPMQTATLGDCVIAKVNGHNEVTFKQLKMDGDRPYLKPLNPSHPPIFEPFKVVGRVVGAGIKL